MATPLNFDYSQVLAERSFGLAQFFEDTKKDHLKFILRQPLFCSLSGFVRNI